MTDWRVDARPRIAKALTDRDQRGLEDILVGLVGQAPEAEIDTLTVELLEAADHDTQMWWTEECECGLHLG